MKTQVLKIYADRNDEIIETCMLFEAQFKLLPVAGDYILYRGSLNEVLKVNYSRRFFTVGLDGKTVDLELKVGYRIFQRDLEMQEL